MSEQVHQHHHINHEEIAVAAYYLWEQAGRPYFNESITFANWIDAKYALLDPVTPAPSGPGHDIE